MRIRNTHATIPQHSHTTLTVAATLIHTHHPGKEGPNIETILTILAILVGSAGGIGIVALIWQLTEYCETRSEYDRAPRISFRSFRRFYDLDPTMWHFNDLWHIAYRKRRDSWTDIPVVMKSFPDFLRFVLWRRRESKASGRSETNKIRAERTEILISEVRRDIDRTLADAEEQNKAAKQQILDMIDVR